MGNDTQWEVTYFKVETITSDSLYANGRMQVPVIVSIKAIEKGTTQRYTLQDADLSKIELIDYDDTASALSDGWSYTDQKNGLFANSLIASAATVNAAIRAVEFSSRTALDPVFQVEQPQPQITARTDDGPQSKKYWVCTTKVESKRVAARVKQPDGTTITTHGSKFDSHVTLTGKTPVVYTTDNVHFVREDTAHGSYPYDWESVTGNWDKGYADWDQDNYYVSSNVHEFVKADIHDYDTTGHDDSRLKNCYAYCAPDNKNLKLSFIWDFGTETTKTAGLYQEATISDWGCNCGRKAYAYRDIKVNQKSNALCLTRLAMDFPDEIWGSKWSNNDCGFTLYDMYGNTGKFYAGFTDDHNLVTIRNAN
ncbi:unnamed protein product [Calypogeia fissa]